MSIILLEEERRISVGGGGGIPNTINPADKSPTISLSGGNLIAQVSSQAWSSARAVDGKSDGIHTFEILFADGGAERVLVGISDIDGAYPTGWWASAAPGGGGQYYAGYHYWNSNISTPKWSGSIDGAYWQYKIDLTNPDYVTINYYLNGGWWKEFVTARTSTSLVFYPAFCIYYLGTVLTFNFGQTDFQYPILGAGLDGWFI